MLGCLWLGCLLVCVVISSVGLVYRCLLVEGVVLLFLGLVLNAWGWLAWLLCC